ncbi:MAG: hypothetical protein RL648_1625 [Verrucomicrobiota bacterium]|jgi:hypothetical protein
MSSSTPSKKVIEYDDHHVRLFVLAGIFLIATKNQPELIEIENP